MQSAHIPTYLKDTTSSRNKDGSINKLENIFFEKENKEKPLTESELLDSRIQLNKHNLSRRSSGGRGNTQSFNNEAIDDEFYRIQPKTFSNLHSKNATVHLSKQNLDTTSKNKQISITSKSNEDFIEIFNKPIRDELEVIHPNDKVMLIFCYFQKI